MKRILPQQFLPQQFLPQQFLPLLLLGLIGCSAGPAAKNTSPTAPATSSPIASVVPSPQSTAAVTQAPSATTAPTRQPPITEPAEVPASVESAQSSPAAEPKVTQTEAVDDPAQRTARIEMARQMDKTTGTVFRNQNWTIRVGGTWSGVNGEGDLTYEGCDMKGQCLTLQGGTASCRDGACVQGWQNGDYRYSLSAPIVGEGEGQPNSSSTLRVYQGDRLILEETGLMPVR